MKKNACAYRSAELSNTKRRGRPKKYGERVRLFSLFKTDLSFQNAPWPNDPKLTIQYCSIKLFWKPFGDLVLFVLTRHPVRGDAIVMSTDLNVDPVSLVTVYSFRFRIEVFFRMAVHQVGAFVYRFWLMQVAFIAHGLLQYLSITCRQTVWSGFGTWLRTIRPNTLASEMVVSMALSGSYSEFLSDGQHCPIFTKFIEEKLDTRYFRHKIPTSAEAA